MSCALPHEQSIAMRACNNLPRPERIHVSRPTGPADGDITVVRDSAPLPRQAKRGMGGKLRFTGVGQRDALIYVEEPATLKPPHPPSDCILIFDFDPCH